MIRELGDRSHFLKTVYSQLRHSEAPRFYQRGEECCAVRRYKLGLLSAEC